METKFGIAKLNNRNFQTWKFKIEMLLSKEDLWETLTNAIPEPRTTEWDRKNRQAMATISLLVEDDQLIHIRKCKTAIEMWNALKGLYERPNLNSKLFLLRKIYKARLKPNQSMDSYINEILETVELLRGLGEELKDNHVAAIILCSIPESYDSLITALEARPESELNLDYVKTKLIDEYRCRKENSAGLDENDDMALKTREQHTTARRTTKECYYCNKPGHIRRDCRILKRQYNNGKHTAKLSADTEQQPPPEVKIEETMEEQFCFHVESNKSCELNTNWFIDSGATSHMANCKEFFNELQLYDKPKNVSMADGTEIEIMGMGSGKLYSRNNPRNLIKIADVLYVPKLVSNLISVKRLTKLGYTVKFKDDTCKISKNRKNITIHANEPLYVLDYTHKARVAQQERHDECIHVWHQRLGHRDPKAIRKLEIDNLTMDLKLKACKYRITCNSCIKGKDTTKPFPKKSETRATHPFELIHSDLCGPMRTSTIGGKKYAITFTDDFSRYSETYLIEGKHETNSIVINYITKWNNYFGYKPRKIRTDGGKEYNNAELNKYLTKHGIQRQITTPYTPQQNGVSERKNRHLLEMTRCMLIDANLGNEYWGEALNTASYLQNRLPHSIHDRTPFELWFGTKPKIAHLRKFGCTAHAHLPNVKLSKLEKRTVQGRLMGYSQEAKAYCIKLDDSNKIIISRNVTFIENVNPGQELTTTPENTDNTTEELDLNTQMTPELENKEISNETEPQLRRSNRINKGIPAPKLSLLTREQEQIEPENIDEIMKMDPSIKENWIQAIKEEMQSFKDNNAWELTTLPEGKTAIGNKWIFKLKYDNGGNIVRYRARLVAKGYAQQKNIDYTETYAPVLKYQTLRILLTIASQYKMKTRHLDVMSAFLNGDLHDEIYMIPPEGIETAKQEKQVYRLNKAIYGLKQSANAWNEKVNKTLISNGYARGESDRCLYTKINGTSITYILLYVDDLLICSNNENQITEITNIMRDSYKMKDLGPVCHYIGIHISQTEDGGYAINQKSKIEKLISQYGQDQAKNISIPMETDYLRCRDKYDKFLNNNSEYSKAIGSLLHIATVTRPDISVSVGLLGRRAANPTNADWKAVLRVIKYLKTTMDMSLIIKAKNKPIMNAYVDSDWAGDNLDRKSTSGHVILLGNTVVGWSSKKQTCTALSTAEAEYVAASAASQDILWSIQLMKDFGQPQQLPVILNEDNQSCIKLIESSKINARSKHIDIKFHMIRDLYEQGVIKLNYCNTEKMLADIFTKPLPKERYQCLRSMLGLNTICIEGEC